MITFEFVHIQITLTFHKRKLIDYYSKFLTDSKYVMALLRTLAYKENPAR